MTSSEDMATPHEVSFCVIHENVVNTLKVAFDLCNMYFDYYGPNKIVDLINQILPTAIVYNTSFWAFYESVQRECLCICHRFGIPCMHTRGDKCWLNMLPVNEGSGLLPKTPWTTLTPFDISVSLTPVNPLRALDVDVKFSIACRKWSDFPENAMPTTFFLKMRFLIVSQIAPPTHDMVTFSPNPMLIYQRPEFYGTCYGANLYLTGSGSRYAEAPVILSVPSCTSPTFTLVMSNFIFTTTCTLGQWPEYPEPAESPNSDPSHLVAYLNRLAHLGSEDSYDEAPVYNRRETDDDPLFQHNDSESILNGLYGGTTSTDDETDADSGESSDLSDNQQPTETLQEHNFQQNSFTYASIVKKNM